MPKITATRPLNHGARLVADGEDVDCSAADAAYYVDRKMATYSTREMTARSPEAPAPAAEVAPVKRGPGRPPGPRTAPTPVGPMTTSNAPSLISGALATPESGDGRGPPAAHEAEAEDAATPRSL